VRQAVALAPRLATYAQRLAPHSLGRREENAAVSRSPGNGQVRAIALGLTCPAVRRVLLSAMLLGIPISARTASGAANRSPPEALRLAQSSTRDSEQQGRHVATQSPAVLPGQLGQDLPHRRLYVHRPQAVGGGGRGRVVTLLLGRSYCWEKPSTQWSRSTSYSSTTKPSGQAEKPGS
jgi:hypothetical protein